MQQKPIIYCSGITEASLKPSQQNLDFWNLQLEPEAEAAIKLTFTHDGIIIDGIETIFPLDHNLTNVLHQISPLDLSYVEQLFDVKEEQVDMILLVRKELTQNLQDLKNAIDANDGKQVKYFAHKLTSKLLVLSIPALDARQFIEDNAQDAQSDAVQKNYYLLKMYCLIRLWQIQDV